MLLSCTYHAPKVYIYMGVFHVTLVLLLIMRSLPAYFLKLVLIVPNRAKHMCEIIGQNNAHRKY